MLALLGRDHQHFPLLLNSVFYSFQGEGAWLLSTAGGRMDSISKYLTDVTLHLRMSPLSIRNRAMVMSARSSFTLAMRKWIEHQQGDETITINRHGATSKVVVTKTTPAPWRLLSFQRQVANHCVSFSLSSHTLRDMGSENVPVWVLMHGNVWIRDGGLKKLRVTLEEVIKGDGSAGLGKWREWLNFVFLSNQKHLQPQKQILIAADAKGIFFMFKVESIIFLPSFQTCSLASNLPNASLSYSLFYSS